MELPSSTTTCLSSLVSCLLVKVWSAETGKCTLIAIIKSQRRDVPIVGRLEAGIILFLQLRVEILSSGILLFSKQNMSSGPRLLLFEFINSVHWPNNRVVCKMACSQPLSRVILLFSVF